MSALLLALATTACVAPPLTAPVGASPATSSTPPSTAPSARPAATTTPGAPLPVIAAPPTPAAPVTPAAPPPILPYEQAVNVAAQALFDNGQRAIAPGKRVLLIDPLLDGASGDQTAATRRLEAQLVSLLGQRYAQTFELRPFTRANLALSPIVLVGTFTAVNNAGRAEEARDAWRICLALADLGANRIVAKGTARAQLPGVDATPLPFYRDAPAWRLDPQVEGYIRTCQGTRAGDPIDARYLDAMQVSALVADAVEQYTQARYSQSLASYRGALGLPGGRQVRVLNGVYLNELRLNRPDAAERAFGDLVDVGLEGKKLSMMFLFQPGSTELVARPQLPTPYTMWLRQIAQRSQAANACLEITGHSSRSGPEPLNERLSFLRAQAVRDRVVALAPRLSNRTLVAGAGSKRTIIGTGADDLSDSIDRRVEMVRLDC